MSEILSIRAPAMLVMASATAKRAEAAGLIKATGGRSPTLIASPLSDIKPELVTAQSATGT